MSIIGQTVRQNGAVLGVVVEEIMKRKTLTLRVKLADGVKRNPVLGDYTLIARSFVQTADDNALGTNAYDAKHEAQLKRAGGDATLLRR